MAEGGADLRAAQAGVMAVAIWPAENVNASQAGVVSVTEASTAIRVAQAGVMIVARGRVADPALRAWGFWLDAHWYYVLRLPTGTTLVYDLSTEQWSIWGSGDSSLWRAFHGTNWLGSGALTNYGSNVLVGDDGNGSLYFLDPLGHADDDAVAGSEIQRPFLREVSGQIITSGTGWTPCFGVRLSGPIGDVDDDTLLTVTLSTSDDRGHSYDDQGAITLTPGDYGARAEWLALGSFPPPGRLFKLSDYGAIQRIDGFETIGGS